MKTLIRTIITGVMIHYCNFSVAAEETFKLMDAVNLTLQNDPFIHIQKENVNIGEANYQQARGQFDSSLNVSVSHNENNQSSWSTASNAFFSADQEELSSSADFVVPFRNGLSLKSGVSVAQTIPDLDEGTGRGALQFTFNVPLMRGLGRASAAGEENALRKELLASNNQYQRIVTERISTAASAYWGYLRAHRSLTILQDAVKRAEVMVGMLKARVEAGHTASSSIKLLEANLIDQQTQLLGEEQDLIRARYLLGLAVGLSRDETEKLPLPSDTFPHLLSDADAILKPQFAKSIEHKALSTRSDLKAQTAIEQAMEYRRSKAKSDLKPRLDLYLSASSAGNSHGNNTDAYFSSLTDNRDEMSFITALSMDWPFANNMAQGKYMYASASLKKASLEKDNMKRNIASSVMRTLYALSFVNQQLMAQKQTESLYAQAVESETAKFNFGLASPAELLVMDERLTSASRRRLVLQNKLANAFIQLRLITGTILNEENDKQSVLEKNLITLPEIK